MEIAEVGRVIVGAGGDVDERDTGGRENLVNEGVAGDAVGLVVAGIVKLDGGKGTESGRVAQDEVNAFIDDFLAKRAVRLPVAGFWIDQVADRGLREDAVAVTERSDEDAVEVEFGRGEKALAGEIREGVRLGGCGLTLQEGEDTSKTAGFFRICVHRVIVSLRYDYSLQMTD